MTSVPVGPTASRSALTAAAGPPATQPIAERDEWTQSVAPASTPSVRRSAVSVPTVRGSGVRAITSASENGEGRTRTGDTPVFSRVLYQLSYLAAGRRAV